MKEVLYCTIWKKIVGIIVLMYCLCPLISAVDEHPDVNFYLKNMTSPQVSDMFRYGNVETSLFTGRLNLQIPIYSLEDPDFNLDVALRYNSEGFKPRKHSGYVGYNWFLEAGGCITREIKNLPDEYKIGYSSAGQFSTKPTEMGMLHFVKDTSVDKNSIFNMDDTTIAFCYGDLYYNLIECNPKVDYLPDLFHFNFCGYSGTFMINNSGKAVVIDGDFIEVDIQTVELRNVVQDNYYVPLHPITQISITTTNGYTYIFGGDIASVEYSFESEKNQIPPQYPPIINSWHLKKIIAPNKRIATFYYKDFSNTTIVLTDPVWLFNNYYDYFATNPFNMIGDKDKLHYKGSTRYAMTKGCYIDSIVISGQEQLKILFHNSISTHTLYNYNYGRNTYVLDSVIVQTNERVLRKANLERTIKSTMNSSNNWRFLASVKIDGIGKYSLMYDYPGHYPDLSVEGEGNHTYLHDFYGYWISSATSYLLKEVQYPTGGKQEFKYGHHDCGEERMYVISDAENVELRSCTRANEKISGARIERIETYIDDQLVETKTYTYKQKNSTKSSGVYYNRNLIFFAKDSTLGLLSSNAGCYSLFSTHIGYSYVEECTKDEVTRNSHKRGYTFNTGLNTYNSQTDNMINKRSPILTDYNPKIYFFIPGVLTYDSQLTRNGHLQLLEYYKNDILTQSTQYDYNGVPQNTTELIPQAPSSLGCIDTIVILYSSIVAVARRLFIYPNLLSQKIIKDYDSNGNYVINTQHFVYDSKYRIKKETMTNSDGTKYFTKHTYIDDLPTSQWHRKLSIPNPYAVLLETNQISRPIETTFGYIDNGQEYTTGGEVKLYGMVLHADFSENNSSQLLPQRLLIDTLKIPDSLRVDITGYHLSPYKTLNLSLAKGVQDYQPIFSNGDTISYDNRYRLTCGYTFDEMNRLVRIAPYGKQETTYTWDGIYPISQTTGNQTSTYTYIPYVGMSSMTDARGVTTYYEYDIYGRLIEVYRMNNGKKEILNKYIHHIQTE